MGEENKKPEEKKVEEGKKGGEGEAKKAAEEAPKKEEKKDEKKEEKKEEKPAEAAKDAPPPPPPEEYVYKVFMHCEGCARKVKRSLRGFEGVEEVITDCKTHKVTVKGKTADPLKVFDRIQRKSHRQVELLTPLPPKPPVEEKKVEEKPKAEEKKEEPPVIIVVLKVHMHCEACSEEIRKRIQKMKGVNSVEPDLKGSQVTVKGVIDPPKLVEYVYKRTGKHAVIVKQETEKKKEEEKGGGEKAAAKGDEKAGEKKEKEGEEGKNASGEGGAVEEVEETKVVEMKKNEFQYWADYAGYHPRYTMEHAYAPAPQIFSDENPNACSVM
ncbi:Heavy metal-associated isoprenylated plant protein 7 [Asimina triloba]